MVNFIKETWVAVATSGIGFVAIGYLANKLIDTRVKESIKSEFTKDIEKYKNEIKAHTDKELAKLGQELKLEYDRIKYSFDVKVQYMTELWNKLAAIITLVNSYEESLDRQIDIALKDLYNYRSLSCPFLPGNIDELVKRLLDMEFRSHEDREAARLVINQIASEMRGIISFDGSLKC